MQAVAAGEQRDQHLIDDLVLADDDLAQLGEDPLAALLDALGEVRNDSVDQSESGMRIRQWVSE